jgi:hypothetical protein
MNQPPIAAEKPPKDPFLLVMFFLVLVIVHGLFTIIALPMACIYDIKFLQSENAFYLWLSQPILVAVCMLVVGSTSQICKTLLNVDVCLSVLQIASVFLLATFADKIV